MIDSSAKTPLVMRTNLALVSLNRAEGEVPGRSAGAVDQAVEESRLAHVWEAYQPDLEAGAAHDAESAAAVVAANRRHCGMQGAARGPRAAARQQHAAVAVVGAAPLAPQADWQCRKREPVLVLRLRAFW